MDDDVRLSRVFILGVLALAVTAVLGSAALILYDIPLQNLDSSHARDLLEASLFIFAFGFLPVLMFAMPVYAAYLSATAFRFWQVVLLAAAPGLLLLIGDSLMAPHFLFFGIAVILSMEGLRRLWPTFFR